MHDVARQLLYVTRAPSKPLRKQLESRGWKVTVASSAKEASQFRGDGLPIGALLDLSSRFDARELVALMPALARTDVGWVASAVGGQLEDASLRGLIRDYCFDYVTLPAPDDRVVDVLGHAYGMAALREQAATDSREPLADGKMVGSCDAMRALYRSIRKVAMTDAPVLISGESGTGKELTAIAIHQRSNRPRGQPFVAINCGAIPAHLLQSELFGYERGAFTGANQRKIGRVEIANGGTLFLDEIGDLPLESQAALLRFVQDRKVDRLGGTARRRSTCASFPRLTSICRLRCATTLSRRPVSSAVRPADRRTAVARTWQGHRIACSSRPHKFKNDGRARFAASRLRR